MTENEIKLIEMIRNHPNPGEAFVKALEIILIYLKHFDSFDVNSLFNSKESV